LSSDDVIHRATAASAQLQSAAFDLTAKVKETGFLILEGTATLSGVVSQGGQQSSLTISLNATVGSGKDQSKVELVGDAATDPAEAYLRVRSFTFNPPPDWLPATASMLGKWWKIPREKGDSEAVGVTPDPLMIQAQAEALRVTEDHGIETINGKDAYHYSVIIDPEQLLQLLKKAAESSGAPFDAEEQRKEIAKYDAAGELWIDAESFVVHRIAWKIVSKEKPPVTSVDLQLDVHDHNSAKPVTLPAASEVTPIEDLMRTLFSTDS
jgi:hypothetical protein